MHASLARKASNSALEFKRLDYPEMDPSEWNKLVTIRLENGDIKVGRCRSITGSYNLTPPPMRRIIKSTVVFDTHVEKCCRIAVLLCCSLNRSTSTLHNSST
jgi:hypothetical protein